jgi:hypothetical protein
MKKFITAVLSHRRKAGLLPAALLLALAFGGSALLRTVAATPAALENLSPPHVKRTNDRKMLRAEVVKLRLIGSYAVTGTDADGKPYPVKHTLGITLAPSGALELEWDNGKNFGVGEVIGDTLAVATWTNGKTVVMTMQINPDGSLTGKWLRRTDHGAKGTETWNKI